ncbi:hypothetical protein ACHAW5_005134 [Stephanodiscus triporus]|uniref:Uncharacterized protein n=1 Tax=Stephanodiscus triporus TaxID=2934178 RepID=A0ABD3NNC5_9STRA
MSMERGGARRVRPRIVSSLAVMGRGEGDDQRAVGGRIPLLDDILRRLFSSSDASPPRRRTRPDVVAPPDPPTPTSLFPPLAAEIAKLTDPIGALVRDFDQDLARVIEGALRSVANDEAEDSNRLGGRDEDLRPTAPALTTSSDGKIGIAVDSCNRGGDGGGVDDGLDYCAPDAGIISGGWGVGRDWTSVGRNGDVAISQTHEWEAVAESYDVDAAAAAAEAAWDDGSRSSPFSSSRWENPPAPLVSRRSWGYDAGSDIADIITCVEVDVEACGMEALVPVETFRRDGQNERALRSTHDSSLASFDYDGDESVLRRHVGLGKMSARETYMAYKKYFDGSPGKEGSINDISIKHNGNDGYGRVFVTEKALVLARSLKLDIFDIFSNKKGHEFDLYEGRNGVDVEMAIVTEGDVREYLDRRYDWLISSISMEYDERGSELRTTNKSVDGSKNRDYRRINDTVLGLHRANKGFQYQHYWKKREDIDGLSKSRFRPFPSKLQPPPREPQSHHEDYRTIYDPPRLSSNDNGYNQGKYRPFRQGVNERGNRIAKQTGFVRRQEPSMDRRTINEEIPSIHSMISVPLSQLVSKPRSEPPQSQESRDISQFQQTSLEIFRKTYRVQQEQQQQQQEMQPKSTSVKNDEVFRFSLEGYPQ